MEGIRRRLLGLACALLASGVLLLRLRAALVAILALPVAALAQQPAKMPRVGFIGLAAASAPSSIARVEGLRAGLRELGHVEGKNIVVEYRWAEGKYDRLPRLAAELVSLNVDVLITQGTDGTRAAKLATTTIPIVMAGVSDPVATGLVDNIARPGGNITGPMFFTQELNTKRLEFLSQALPRSKRFAALVNPDNTSHLTILRAMESTARTLGLDLQKFEARAPGDFESVFNAMASRGIRGVVVVDDGMFNANIMAIGDHATKRKLPAIGVLDLPGAGGLIAYGVKGSDLFRREAAYVDKILKGAKPSDLPIERIASYELVINKKVAKELGVTIPQSMLIRADRVIE